MQKAYHWPFLLALLACSDVPEEKRGTSSPANNAGHAASVTIHPVHHSALVLRWKALTLHIDPHAGLERYMQFPAPDLILITDIHSDHLDTATLRGLDLAKANIIAPRAVIELLPPDLQTKAILVQNGDKIDVKGVRIEGVPMYNMPDLDDPRHPKGRGNGYVLTLGSERFYISGDTEDIPEMRGLRNIDVAFVCMNQPYTMTVEQAAAGVVAFKPRVVYPYHYRGKDGFSDIARFEQLVKEGDPSMEVKLVDWYMD